MIASAEWEAFETPLALRTSVPRLDALYRFNFSILHASAEWPAENPSAIGYCRRFRPISLIEIKHTPGVLGGVFKRDRSIVTRYVVQLYSDSARAVNSSVSQISTVRPSRRRITPSVRNLVKFRLTVSIVSPR